MSFIRKYLFSIVVTIIIFYLSTAPASSFPKIPSFTGIDKVVHILMYAGLAFVLTLEISTKKKITYYLYTILLPILYGGLIEIVQQNFFPPRTGSWGDFLADIAGVLLGHAAALVVLKIKKKKESNV